MFWGKEGRREEGGRRGGGGGGRRMASRDQHSTFFAVEYGWCDAALYSDAFGEHSLFKTLSFGLETTIFTGNCWLY